MYSRDSYLENLVKMDKILTEGLIKSPENKKILEMTRLSNNMFFYTSYMINKHDSLELENRILYNKLRDAQLELEKHRQSQK